jgi:hypothetical protein
LTQESRHTTPYERYLQQTLNGEKIKLDELNAEYSKANPIKKIQLRRELDLVTQNVRLLSADLSHYENTGLEWLREPTKERDEKSESLKPVPIEAITGQAAAGQKSSPAASPGTSASQPKGAPMVGRPVGSPTVGRPAVGQPIGRQAPRPVSESQQSKPAPSSPQPAESAQAPKPTPSAPRVGAPIVGKPVGTAAIGKLVSSTPQQAPRVGTPISSLVKKEEKTAEASATTEQSKENEQKREESSDTTSSSTSAGSS